MKAEKAIARAVQEEREIIIDLIKESKSDMPRVLETYFCGQSPSIAKYQERLEE